MKTVGVVGVGIVGGAMLEAFKDFGLNVIAYDKFRPGFTDEEVHFDALVDADLVFVSVPTLTKDSGAQDTEPFEDVLKRLTQINYKGIVVSKCTTLPGTTRTLQNRYPSLRLVHYPEFLTAANAFDDFKYQKAALLSGQQEHVLEVAEFLRDLFPRIPIRLFQAFASTEIAKYIHNCFLATKVSLLNEFYDICDTYRVSYSDVISGVEMLGKIGESHLKVPGPDGKRGWAGYCFPKDTKALLYWMDAQGIPMDTLKGAVESNKKVRGA